MIAAIVAALLGSSPEGEPVSARAAAARVVLRQCGPEEAPLAAQPDKTWEARPDALGKHAALRAALGQKMPHASSMVLVHAVGGHLGTEEDSIILSRADDGRWSGTAVGRSRIWVQDAPYVASPGKQWTLPAEAGQRLDRILDDKCFYAEPAAFDSSSAGPPPLGAMVLSLDVLTPSRRRSALFLGGEAKGRTAEIVQLSLPR